jgi:uncharacterized protein YjbI with pentapeptide repeats
MANEEQLSILKQGVEVWNKWRDENRTVEIDLSRAHLIKVDLTEANFSEANLSEADLSEANLSRAEFRQANLEQANLSGAILSDAYLGAAHLSGAILRGASCSKASLSKADLSRVDLSRANLERADLRGAILQAILFQTNLSLENLFEADLRRATLLEADLGGTHLDGSNFFQARVGDTIFGSSDLSEVRGLDNVHHSGPSAISTDTFSLSKGKIPDVFLRGCGLSDWEVEGVKLYNPHLSNDDVNQTLYRMYELRATQALQVSPLFVSYSHEDSEFVDKIGDSLTKKGVRYWRDIHDMKAGRMEKQIDRAISQNRTVLLVLSENSLKSDWVEHEVRTARELEKEMGRDVLCPVALDDSWKSSHWPKRVMEQIMEYNILDFSAWKDDSKFDSMFRKLIDGLELFYKGESHGE